MTANRVDQQDRVDPPPIDCDETGIPRFWPDGTPHSQLESLERDA
jgi:hypothetical protein